jgi:subtilisin family serine protease
MDSVTALDIKDQFETVILDLRSAGHYPLFVIAAGDDGIDAFWEGIPPAKLDADYAEQMIVVGSNNNNSSQTGTLSSFSDRGSLVDMVAPGNNVGVLNKSGSLTTSFSGTSFSAPFVSGAAGQVVTFDPTLDSATVSTTTALKSLILQGAVDGGRTAGGFPILNAYKSLRRASRKHGARICGNLVWAQGNRTISVMRNDSTNDIETLVSSLVGEPYLLQLHRGREFREREMANRTHVRREPT